MVEYKCSKCDRVYNHKGNYERHINRKKTCSKNERSSRKSFDSEKDDSQSYSCPDCGKTYTKKSLYVQHLVLECSNTDGPGQNSQFLSTREDCEVLECSNDENIEIGLFCPKTAPEDENQHQKAPKTAPKMDNSRLVEYKNNIKCNFCGATFVKKYGLKRHLKDRCKVKVEFERLKEREFQKLLQENEELKKTIAGNTVGNTMANNSTVSSNSNNNNNNTVINQVNNIKLVSFGKEDLSYIPDKDTKKIIKKGFQSVPDLIKMVHFNENNPQMHNVYIPNIKNPYAMIYDEKWQLSDLDETIKLLYDEKKLFLENAFERLGNVLDYFAVKKFNNFLTQEEENEEENEEEVLSDIYKRIKLLLYNNRDVPIKTRQQMKDGESESSTVDKISE